MALLGIATIAFASMMLASGWREQEEATSAVTVGASGGGSTVPDEGTAVATISLSDAAEERPTILGPPVESIPLDHPPAERLASVAAERLESHFGARFAGAWDIEHVDGTSTAVVALVDPLPADVDAVGDITGSTQISTPAAEYSLDDLEELSADLSEELADSGLESYAVGVNVPTNRVTLMVGADDVEEPELREWLVEVGSLDEVILEVGTTGLSAAPLLAADHPD